MSLAKGAFAAAEYASATIPEYPKLAPWVVPFELGEEDQSPRSRYPIHIFHQSSDAYKNISTVLVQQTELQTRSVKRLTDQRRFSY